MNLAQAISQYNPIDVALALVYAGFDEIKCIPGGFAGDAIVTIEVDSYGTIVATGGQHWYVNRTGETIEVTASSLLADLQGWFGRVEANDRLIDRYIADGAFIQLGKLLDCHVFSLCNDYRALEHLAWRHCLLTSRQEAKIERWFEG